jgi:hypothetical protein
MIRELATRFEAPVFDPHLTLLVAPENSRPPAAVISDLGKTEVRLSIVDVRSSKLFTKTLFVQFDLTSRLHKLCETINMFAGVRESYNLDPHLSLLYKGLPEQRRQELVRSIQLPFHEITFGSLCAVRCASPTQTADDVRRWKVIAQQADLDWIPRLGPG